jgi:hypothetical protein
MTMLSLASLAIHALFLLICACCLGLTQSGLSQQANERKGGILGYLDTRTGAFRPVQQTPITDEEAALPPVTATTGKIVYKITATIASTNLGSDTIVCEGSAAVEEIGLTGLTFSAQENASVIATVAAGKATCTVTIPYSWLLTTPATDSINLNFSVFAAGGTAGGGQPTVPACSHYQPSKSQRTA